jgi:excinuclease ABC subunit A
VCPACAGARLKPESLLWRLGSPPGLSIHDLMLLPIERVLAFFASLELPPPFDDAGQLVLDEIRTRLRYLCDVGLSYLTLDRQSRTLSGGEVQRINLTTALGTSLVNTLFVLDEPSIGLHPRDLGRVVGVLRKLRDAGNTLLVVEHDAQVMLAADRIIDMGPGPGRAGGQVVFNGTPRELTTTASSVTAQYLRGERRIGRARVARSVALGDPHLVVRDASAHNLRHVDAAIPLNRLVCITGVSGSGKSTLVQEVLYNGLIKLFGKPKDSPGAHAAIDGFEHIDDVVLVDQ